MLHFVIEISCVAVIRSTFARLTPHTHPRDARRVAGVRSHHERRYARAISLGVSRCRFSSRAQLSYARDRATCASSSVLTINQALTVSVVFHAHTALVEVAKTCQTLVTLTCASCGASVAPCDVCQALVETRGARRGERPARCCARCGGLCVSGDALRARLGLRAIHFVDPLRAVDMVIASGRAGTRERCLSAKRARLTALASAPRPFSDPLPLHGSTNRRRPNSITTTDDTGTPTDAERERDCRRLTSSSVQCGQRLPPDSIFKTPAPTSRLGRVSTVPNSASSSPVDDALALGDKIEGEMTRLKLQILHLESMRRRKGNKRDFTSVNQDILKVSLKRSKVTDESVEVVLDIASSFLRDRAIIQRTMDNCAESRLALETLERDTHLMNVTNTDKPPPTRDSPSEVAPVETDSPFLMYWPKMELLENVLPGVMLLKNQLQKRATRAEKAADECGAVHLKRLGEITRTQNELFSMMNSKDSEANHAAHAALQQLILLYAAMFNDIVIRRERQMC